MDLLSTMRKTGSRGGVNFSWDEVASSSHRENYLGHSLKAPIGRWQKGKDLNWYAKADDAPGNSNETGEERAVRLREEELRKIKEAEEDAMARELGLPVPQRNTSGANATEVGNQRKIGIASTENGGNDGRRGDRTRRRAEDPDRKERRRRRSQSRSRSREDRRGHDKDERRHRRRDRSRDRDRDRDREQGRSHRSRERHVRGHADRSGDGRREERRHYSERQRSRDRRDRAIDDRDDRRRGERGDARWLDRNRGRRDRSDSPRPAR